MIKNFTFIVIIVLILLISYISKKPNKKLNIIQTWKNNNIPPKYKKLIKKIKLLNPEANYMFFSDDDMYKFVEEKFPKYYKFFNILPLKIQKIDFFRYLCVYYYGGVYLDLDIELYKPFDFDTSKALFPKEFTKNSDKILQDNNLKYLIGNYAFYAPKNCSFLKHIIENIINKKIHIRTYNKNKFVYYTTGPVMVSFSYLTFKDKSKIEIIEPTPFKPNHFGEYGEHKKFGSWK